MIERGLHRVSPMNVFCSVVPRTTIYHQMGKLAKSNLMVDWYHWKGYWFLPRSVSSHLPNSKRTFGKGDLPWRSRRKRQLPIPLSSSHDNITERKSVSQNGLSRHLIDRIASSLLFSFWTSTSASSHSASCRWPFFCKRRFYKASFVLTSGSSRDSQWTDGFQNIS